MTFLGERHFKNFFNDSHSTKYEHSHYNNKLTHTVIKVLL